MLSMSFFDGSTFSMPWNYILYGHRVKWSVKKWFTLHILFLFHVLCIWNLLLHKIEIKKSKTFTNWVENICRYTQFKWDHNSFQIQIKIPKFPSNRVLVSDVSSNCYTSISMRYFPNASNEPNSLAIYIIQTMSKTVLAFTIKFVERYFPKVSSSFFFLYFGSQKH